MLSTSNLPAAGQAKTFSPGNHVLRINKVELAKGYKEGSYQVKLFMETQDMGENFEGFFVDPVAKSGDRYKGQVGTVKMSQYNFENKNIPATATRAEIKIDRDQSILRGLQNISKVLGVQDKLDAIQAHTIEEYVPMASEVLASGGFANFIISGKEYLNKAGYTQYELFLPNSKGGKYAFTSLGEGTGKLMDFDPAVHIIPLAETPATPVEGFEATKKSSFAI